MRTRGFNTWEESEDIGKPVPRIYSCHSPSCEHPNEAVPPNTKLHMGAS